MTGAPATDTRRLQGAWGPLTLTSILDTAALARRDKVAFIDAPDIDSWGDRAPKLLAVADLQIAVARFARQILTLGLKRGDRVLVAMPNCTQGITTLLGIMRAGLVPCPISIVASSAEILAAAEAVQSSAIITVDRYAKLTPAQTARSAASQYYGVRFVCAYGRKVPEGVVSLGYWPDNELHDGPLPDLSPEEAALITFDRNDGAMVPHVRSHAQLISDALALSAIAGLAARSSIVSTFAPVSAAGFIATVAAPIVSGARAVLHGPFDADILAAQLGREMTPQLVIPAVVEPIVTQAIPATTDLIVVVRDPSIKPQRKTTGRRTEMISLGESAVITCPRPAHDTKLRLLRQQPHPIGNVLARNQLLSGLDLSRRGTLTVEGFATAPRWTSTGADAAHLATETGWLARSDGANHLLLTGEAGQISDDDASMLVTEAA
jgi:mycobactin salicyl-AMP ligase